MRSLPVKAAERKEKAVNSRPVCVRVSGDQRVSGQRGDPRSGREHSKLGCVQVQATLEGSDSG